MEKLLIALEDPTPQARDGFDSWARLLAKEGYVDRAEVEHLNEPAHRAHTQKPVRFYSYASFWLDEAYHDQVLSHPPVDTAWFLLRERLAFDRSARPDEARPWAGIKKTTLWCPVSSVDRKVWWARYTNHGPIASVYHGTCIRYRQNVILAGSDPELGGVSELWWTNVEDLTDRFYLSDEAEQLLAVDAGGFVDMTRSYPTVTNHETLRVGESGPSHGGFL